MKRRSFFGAVFGAAAVPVMAKAAESVDALADSMPVASAPLNLKPAPIDGPVFRGEHVIMCTPCPPIYSPYKYPFPDLD